MPSHDGNFSRQAHARAARWASVTAGQPDPARSTSRAQRGQRLLVEGGSTRHFADDAPVIGGKEPLPSESRRRMRSRMAGNKLVAITCLLTKASAPLSEAMSR